MSKLDLGKDISRKDTFATAIARPWVLLFREPVVPLLSVYMAIIYGTLYMLFAAFPIVYQEGRGWNEGIGGLSFLGVVVGVTCAAAYSIFDNKRFVRALALCDGATAPEARLPPALVGAVALPAGLFWFAWTNFASIHWIVSILGTAPFGFGMVLVCLSILNYLIDAYVPFAASVLASATILRSIFGAVFPLFTSYMYRGLGVHWASSIPAFLAVLFCPFPFLFYRYGKPIRARCKYAAEAESIVRKLRNEPIPGPGPGSQELNRHVSVPSV